MPIHVAAEATCDHCGKTVPCRLDWAFVQGTTTFGGRSVRDVSAAIRGLDTWFVNHDALACSEACKVALANDPTWRWSDFGNKWESCALRSREVIKAGRSAPVAANLPTFCGACGWRVTPAEIVCPTPSTFACPMCGTAFDAR